MMGNHVATRCSLSGVVYLSFLLWSKTYRLKTPSVKHKSTHGCNFSLSKMIFLFHFVVSGWFSCLILSEHCPLTVLPAQYKWEKIWDNKKVDIFIWVAFSYHRALRAMSLMSSSSWCHKRWADFFCLPFHPSGYTGCPTLLVKVVGAVCSHLQTLLPKTSFNLYLCLPKKT